MRRHLLALLAVAVLVLAGCGGKGSSDKSSSTTAAASAKQPLKCGGSFKGVKVSGPQGQEPKVTIDTPFTVSKSVCHVLIAGTGTAANLGDTVVVRYDFFNARTGKAFDSSYSKQKDVPLVLSEQFLTGGLPTGLLGTKAGGRVVTAVSAADGYGPEGGQSQYGINKDDSLVFVADVISVSSPVKRATGDAVAPVAGLPTVTLAGDGAPTITVPPGTTAPTKLVVQPLIKGKGPLIASGQTITVAYTGVIFSSGKTFDSTWTSGREPFSFPLGQQKVIPGWDTGLIGQTVGSQVLLVVPPADGYGTAGNSQAGITGTDTLVFVVDILNAA